MLKIKVNLDKESYGTICQDMLLFKIVKKDGTINKNKFMNILFSNFYKSYQDDMIAKTIDAKKIMDKYGIYNDSLAQELSIGLEKTNQELSEIYYNKSLTFYLDDENEFIFDNLDLGLKFQTASAYFRKLIYRYLSFAKYKREEIIFKSIVDTVNEAIANNKKIKIKIKEGIIELAPYKISTSKEQLYSYLVGVIKNSVWVGHIYKIEQVAIINKTFTLTNQEKELLDLNIENGIQFAANKMYNAEIELNERGIELFQSRYLHRPSPTHIEGNRYFFKCSANQLFAYFLSFGGNIKVIEPKFLAKAIYESYKNYIDNYEE